MQKYSTVPSSSSGPTRCTISCFPLLHALAVSLSYIRFHFYNCVILYMKGSPTSALCRIRTRAQTQESKLQCRPPPTLLCNRQKRETLKVSQI